MAQAKTTSNQIDENTWEVIKTFINGKEEKRIVKDPIEIWLIGNTGMRNPWRIPGGFKIYVESSLVGRIREPKDQVAFKNLLYSVGEIGGDPSKDRDASITRKYRLMFNKYGFAYPEVGKKELFSQADLGPIDSITPLGETFYNADTIQGQQECFLRGLIVPMEKLDEQSWFSPIRWVFQIMFELHELTGDYRINFIEFASCVQTTNPKYDATKVAQEIVNIRNNRMSSENKKMFDRMLLHEASKRYLKEAHNFKDYADMNIRYLISSGVLKRSGRGITLVSEYKTLAKELSLNPVSTESLKNRLTILCNGAPLPTDTETVAKNVLNDLLDEIEFHKIPYTMPELPLDSPQNINVVRKSLKQDIDRFKEEQYAKNQRKCWKEIYEYMQLLIDNNGRTVEFDDDYEIKVPKSEAAAYLEWILWRAFLAVNHIVNKPYESRRFKIDQDYFPVGTAPGGGPDMIFEFDEYIIAVEVTLSTNSRQEAMEGEPVRRHIADLVRKYDKPVYGLFVANKIDSNTAETFRIGVWYGKDDARLELFIVPFTLKQFSLFFKSMFETDNIEPYEVVNLMLQCIAFRKSCEAPEWKKRIDTLVIDKCKIQ